METSSFDLPDFTDFENRLLAEHGAITLVPGVTTVDGSRLQLIPVRDNVKLEGDGINGASYPLLDLAAAGIEIDRRLETVQAAASAFIKGRTFRVQPDQSIIRLLFTARKILEAMELQAFAMRLKSSLLVPLRRLADEFWAPFNQIPYVSLRVIADGEIPGLDLSKGVSGSVLSIATFAMPISKLPEDELKVLRIAVTLCGLQVDGCASDEAMEAYVAAHGEASIRDWFSSKRSKLKKDCDDHHESFRRFSLAYEAAYAALKEGKSIDDALSALVPKRPSGPIVIDARSWTG